MRFLRAIVFDFDGVILDSARIKERAFLKIFRADASSRPGILSYLRRVQEQPRWIKIRHVLTSLLTQPCSKARVMELCREYESACYGKILACPLVAGAGRMIRQNHFLKFICSGTPERELRRILVERKLQACFEAGFGAPRTKPVILKTILRRWRLPPSEVLYVGDSIGDYRSAMQAGVSFVGRIDPRIPDPFKDISVPKVADLNGLARHLRHEYRRTH